MVKALHFSRFGAYFGASFGSFNLGFSISRYAACIDLGFFWFSLEW